MNEHMIFEEFLSEINADFKESAPLNLDLDPTTAFAANLLEMVKADNDETEANIGEMLKNVENVIWRVVAESILNNSGTITLKNTFDFPFNNSVQSVALSDERLNTDYIVITEIVSADGIAGEIEVSDKLVNGFKIAYTGSASSVTVKYIVIGGYPI